MYNKNNKVRKILVSGGWGYGNLGDDALLFSTVDLIKEKYPNSEIIIMSYDCIETSKVLENRDIRIIPSVHRIISKKLAFKKLGTWKKSINFFIYPQLVQRIISRFQYPFLISKEEKIFLNKGFFMGEIQESLLYDEFKDSDLFIMSGGGYFNSWIDNLSARIIELELAHKANTKSLIIGQSIGPFITSELSEAAYSGLKFADLISVRDAESLKELKSLGLKCSIAPDLALSNIDFEKSNVNEIAIILGEFPNSKLNELTNALINISKIKNCSYKLLLTRLYNADVVSIKKTYKILADKGVDVRLLIPTSYQEIQRELSKSKVVVSRNLHGLIMGWRSGVPSVCLNNERKFLTFMEQSGQIDRLMGLKEISEKLLTEKILSAYDSSTDYLEKRNELANSVKSNFFECVEKLE